MALTGRQKAAILLTSLDAVTASELLKGVKPELVQELAVELAYLDAAGLRDAKQTAEVTTQFYNSLQPGKVFHLRGFLDTMLKSSVGDEHAKLILTQIEEMLRRRDPFLSIRTASAQLLAAVLCNEHPQAIAVVLSELPPKKSSEVLGLLGDEIRLGAISGMTSVSSVTVEARRRIAEMISKRIQEMSEDGAKQASGDQGLRKIAIILRNLGKELRDGMLAALQEKDSQVAEKVSELMIVWEDVIGVADRSLQEALRGVDGQKLALALYKAEEELVKKIKANISERAAATIDEETALMSSPRKEDINNARQEIVTLLREMNKKGELNFIEE